MTDTQRTVALVTIGLIAAFVLVDLTAMVLHGSSATISEVLGHAGRHYPILPMTLAVLMGHVFGGASKPLQRAQDWVAGDVGLLLVIMMGLVIGAVCWPNR